MTDLEERLRQRDTSDLQQALYRNELTSSTPANKLFCS